MDVFPADADDVTVGVGPTRLRIAVDHDACDLDRTISPPGRCRVFAGERAATCNNGVLTVTVDTDWRWRRRGLQSMVDRDRRPRHRADGDR